MPEPTPQDDRNQSDSKPGIENSISAAVSSAVESLIESCGVPRDLLGDSDYTPAVEQKMRETISSLSDADKLALRVLAENNTLSDFRSRDWILSPNIEKKLVELLTE